MHEEGLKLTLYFGERDRSGGRFLADVLADIYEAHGLRTSVVVRGVEGFGLKHHLHTERLLTLSEDLPLVSVAVDTRAAIESVLPDVRSAMGDGLISLERARLLTGGEAGAPQGLDREGAAKLTVYAGRSERHDGRPAALRAIELLREHGFVGGSAIVGVDGTLHGERRRARFFSRNVDVVMMVLAVGPVAAVESGLPALSEVFEDPVITLERVRVCKREGERIAEPLHVSERDDAGFAVWQKIMVHAEQQARAGGHPLHGELVRRLRAAGAAGATCLRGVVGFYGERGLFMDRMLTLRRNVPLLTVMLDTPDRVRAMWPVIDEVTSEPVPASHARSSNVERGRIGSAVMRRLREDEPPAF